MTNYAKTPDKNPRWKACLRERGRMKDRFAELGGGEAYLRQEREETIAAWSREALRVEATQESKNSRD
jgi:hypothetical protein